MQRLIAASMNSRRSGAHAGSDLRSRWQKLQRAVNDPGAYLGMEGRKPWAILGPPRLTCARNRVVDVTVELHSLH
jgi:hypothetical protein